jgi:hypothetical protein
MQKLKNPDGAGEEPAENDDKEATDDDVSQSSKKQKVETTESAKQEVQRTKMRIGKKRLAGRKRTKRVAKGENCENDVVQDFRLWSDDD